MAKKIIFIVIDGLGDKPIKALGNKTPLEAAKTPNLDFMAENGIYGLIEPFLFPWQELPASDISHLALFGYDPKTFYLGRGPYEAAGLGIKLKKGDIALRANFAAVSKDLIVLDRRAGRIEKTQPLIKILSRIKIKGVKILVKRSFGHRAVLVLRGKRLSSKLTDNDPKKEGETVKKVLPADKSKEARFTAAVLNEFLDKARQFLKNQVRANYFLVRGAGQIRETPSFEKRYGLKACCVAGGALYKGIAKILGMDLIKVKGASGLPNTNLKGKFLAAKKAINKYDFVFLHIKAADNFAEDGNFLAKKDFLEKIDKNIKHLLGLKNTLIVLTGDHSTCSELKRHCVDSIPILISGFSRGKLSRPLPQLEVLPMVLKLLL
ncbi:MAG: 2,3-bisphosphoglycerate-independent phosphoglycerate mutase [Candidatus Nealsonbacteria bacterium]|nr:2,3-bisphosphoglycerate-independent phosphoglycerate mutase [Candidatus Nealsonbacteria bacterium]